MGHRLFGNPHDRGALNHTLLAIVFNVTLLHTAAASDVVTVIVIVVVIVSEVCVAHKIASWRELTV
jgi:hypothetical protein